MWHIYDTIHVFYYYLKLIFYFFFSLSILLVTTLSFHTVQNLFFPKMTGVPVSPSGRLRSDGFPRLRSDIAGKVVTDMVVVRWTGRRRCEGETGRRRCEGEKVGVRVSRSERSDGGWRWRIRLWGQQLRRTVVRGAVTAMVVTDRGKGFREEKKKKGLEKGSRITDCPL